MTFVSSLDGPSIVPKAIGGSIPTTVGVRGRMTLLLVERPDATTDAASGRFSAPSSTLRRPNLSTQLIQ